MAKRPREVIELDDEEEGGPCERQGPTTQRSLKAEPSFQQSARARLLLQQDVASTASLSRFVKQETTFPPLSSTQALDDGARTSQVPAAGSLPAHPVRNGLLLNEPSLASDPGGFGEVEGLLPEDFFQDAGLPKVAGHPALGQPFDADLVTQAELQTGQQAHNGPHLRDYVAGPAPPGYDGREALRAGPPVNSQGPSSRGNAVTGVSRRPALRNFWKAGELLPVGEGSSQQQSAHNMDHLRVHPRFLHSNATSHKWVLGAMAELLDNSMDEVRNGASYASVDKLSNPLDGTPMLAFEDDGGGMGPEQLRFCMSLGYSHKTNSNTIGQYGNGFKTSTMRQGADVIVFTRRRGIGGQPGTQSLGLLSYTFLTQTGRSDIVVPMVDYALETSTGACMLEPLVRGNLEAWRESLNTIIEWSPFKTEAELLAQFASMGQQGTKVLIYNLWETDDGELELDFDKDPEDIHIRGAEERLKAGAVLGRLAMEGHVAGRCRYSLRAYASILYLNWPKNFRLLVRGKPVQHCRIASLLKNVENVLYKPHVTGVADTATVVTIGFAKEAPNIDLQGFCVYHKNRLIKPFWRIWNSQSSAGRGVVGVLEADFVQPAHDKQDFEASKLLQKLEKRLIDMQREYWKLYAPTIGYDGPVPRVRKPKRIEAPPMNGSVVPTPTVAGQQHAVSAPPELPQQSPPSTPQEQPASATAPLPPSSATPSSVPAIAPLPSRPLQPSAPSNPAAAANCTALAAPVVPKDAVADMDVEDLREVFAESQKGLEARIKALHERVGSDTAKAGALSVVEEELVKWQQWSLIALAKLSELASENARLRSHGEPAKLLTDGNQ